VMAVERVPLEIPTMNLEIPNMGPASWVGLVIGSRLTKSPPKWHVCKHSEGAREQYA